MQSRIHEPEGTTVSAGKKDCCGQQEKSAGMPVGGRHAKLLHLQRTLGNRHVQRLVNLSCKAEQESEVSPDVENTINQARGGGQQLDNTVQAQMSEAFNVDFTGVRVHTGTQSDSLNKSLSARAFTTGQDIFFGQGEYSPGSSSGRKLLAHELTHVVQQQSMMSSGGPLTVGPADDPYEREADRIADQVAVGAGKIDSSRGRSDFGDIQAAQREVSGGGGEGNIQRGFWDTVTDEEKRPELLDSIGGLAGSSGLFASSLNGLGYLSDAASGAVGGGTSVLGLLTGGYGMYDSITRPGTYGLDDLTDTITNGLSVVSGGIGAAGMFSSSLAAGGSAGLSATTAAAFGGTAATAAGSAGAVIGSGLVGYGIGRGLDKGVGGLMDLTGASSYLDEMRGISRPEGQNGDYSLSGLGALGATALDQTVTGGLRSIGVFDEDKPAYTQTLGWRLAEALPSWLQ